MQLILSRIYTHANSYVYECMCVCLLFDDEAKLHNKLNFSKKSIYLKWWLRATYDFEGNIS